MADNLPYLISPKRFPELLSALQTAAIPTRVTTEVLKKFGFTSSNERAYPALLKKLGFLSPTGEPTSRYKAYRDRSSARRALADGIREAYSELFQMNTEANKATKEQLRGLISRISDKEQGYVTLIAATFGMLCEGADFSVEPATTSESIPKTEIPDMTRGAGSASETETSAPPESDRGGHHRSVSFRYNIEIHLPATNDIAVYNAIFRSIKEHLGN